MEAAVRSKIFEVSEVTAVKEVRYLLFLLGELPDADRRRAYWMEPFPPGQLPHDA